MANISGDKIVKLWIVRPYGHGWANYRDRKYNYIDYFLEDLATMLIEQDKVKLFEKYLKGFK